MFPGDPRVGIHPVATIERDGYYLQSFTAGEQAGTHWAAPAHFRAGQAAADELDPGDFFTPRSCLTSGRRSPGTRTSPSASRKSGNGKRPTGRPPGSAVIMRTASRTVGRPGRDLNADPDGGLHYPGFGDQATHWLIQHRSIGALGIDTMGIDPGADTDFVPTSCSFGTIASIWRTFADWARCRWPAAGSSSEESGSGQARLPGHHVRADPMPRRRPASHRRRERRFSGRTEGGYRHRHLYRAWPPARPRRPR